MKKKDIISLIICLIIIVVAIYFGLKMMGIGPKSTPKTASTTTKTQEKTFTGNIDQETLDNISKLNDYGEASLDGIGRVNPFAPLN
jgi:hypothetical protein